jgi:hypothetical protein
MLALVNVALYFQSKYFLGPRTAEIQTIRR